MQLTIMSAMGNNRPPHGGRRSCCREAGASGKPLSGREIRCRRGGGAAEGEYLWNLGKVRRGVMVFSFYINGLTGSIIGASVFYFFNKLNEI